MIFRETELPGVFLVDVEPKDDERGSFTRIWDSAELAEQGLDGHVVQCSVSHNARAGTLRGLHYQEEPHAETKLVRCLRGALYDVALDLRPSSPTFKRWVGVELRAGEPTGLYIPKGFAHGFQTLADDTEIFYAISELYEPTASRGVRWDDPAFAIEWPEADSRVISERDRTWADFQS
jgi:dTDP-4-dehydrorhamnose 3,5-epimerase